MPTPEMITGALNWRYATKIFDSTKKVSDDDLKTILESGRLAPSSYGLEPWTFIVVENKEIREKLKAASYGQPKVTDASHLVIIARRTDMRQTGVADWLARTSHTTGAPFTTLDAYKQMIDGAMAIRDDASLDAWSARQTYLALGMMMETAALMHIDSCALEGFDATAVDEILNLPAQHLTVTTMLTLGYRGNDEAASRPKVRRTPDDAIKWVK